MAHLMQVLDRNGFRPVQSGGNPDILLTVQYGRGWLSNPYLGSNQAIEGVTSVSATTGSNAGLAALPNRDLHANARLADEMMPGFQAKAERASYEKLFISVVAWAYPWEPNASARMLWKTTVVADDPDHRDLNAIAPKLLTAAAPYFDRGMKEPELEIYSAMPGGHVQVGAPVVVEPAPKPALAAAAPAVVRPAEPATKFALSAGEALESLQAFVQQSGEKIIYPVEQVLKVRTQAVHGEFTARAALDRMFVGSGLVADLDEKTGVFVIHRATH